MHAKRFFDSLEDTKKFTTHEGQVESLLYLGCAVLIAILGRLEVDAAKEDE